MTETLTQPEPQPSSDEVMDDGTEDHSRPEIQNPKDTSSSDSDSENEEEEAQQNLQIQTLEMELVSNPGNYDAHVQYIKALRKKGELDKLRQAREAMSELFPLPPAMWQEWAKDESSLISGSDAFPAIEKIYGRGVFDYLSVSLWCDYVSFVQEHDVPVRECSAVGTSKARNLFERALTAAGLHIAEGSKIWEAYRKFEQSIYHAIPETDIESREKQVQRIRKIFHRQLSVPHKDLISTLLTYKIWEAEPGNNVDVNSTNLDGISSHVASAYQKALEMVNARAKLEDEISKKDVPDTERLQWFMSYLKFEQTSGDPARVQILFDRAITEFPISPDLWLNYTMYLDKTLKATRAVTDVYNRATRNCPWVGELWVRYLLSLERSHASEREISAVFEKALQCTFSSFEEYLDIFLTRVDGLRRRISFTGEVEDALDYSLIRDTFQRASDYLSQQLKGTDSLLRMHRYWARLESNIGKDLVAARGVWETLLKSSGSVLEAWKGYIAMEIEMGHIKEARSLYKRCYSKRFFGMGSEEICHSWIRFEREFGTLEDFDHAVKKVTPRLEELQFFRLQQESKDVDASTDQMDKIVKKNEKRKPVSDIADEHSPVKRHKGTAQNQKKANNEKVNISIEAKKKEGAEVQENKPGNSLDAKTKDLRSEKPQYKDQCTAFVSNLSLQATYEDLRKFFSDVGGAQAIRILTEKFTGKSRGFAYVDFSDDAHLAAAVAKNKQTLLGKKISIARSDPKRKNRESGGHSTPMEHGKQTSTGGRSDSKQYVEVSEGSRGPGAESVEHRRGDDKVQLKGKNTFAVPRAVRPLGWINKDKPKTETTVEGGDEPPKSNDEFRKMFLK